MVCWRENKVHLQTGAEPSQYRATRNRAKTNQNRARTEPSRAESQRSRAETERIRTEPCRKARGRHAEGKITSFGIFSRFCFKPCRIGAEPASDRIAFKLDRARIDTDRLGCDRIGLGLDRVHEFFLVGERTHSSKELNVLLPYTPLRVIYSLYALRVSTTVP